MPFAKQKIGLIGTGVMGGGIARNLIKDGFTLAVYNRTQEKARPIVDLGAEWCSSVGKLARNADIILTMVGYPSDVEEIYFGKEGILENAKPGSILVDMTTSKPSLAKKIYEAALEKGLRALDAPVSGGDTGAREGTLTIMAGGDRDIFETLAPLFDCIGSKAVLQGGAGAGQHTKMCNQIAIASNIMGACEAMAYAQKAGLDPQSVLDSISTGAAGSWQLSAYAPRILKGDFQPGFYIKHFVKDMRIALEEAEEMGLDTPALRLSKSLYEKLMEKGLENEGAQALFKLYRNNW